MISAVVAAGIAGAILFAGPAGDIEIPQIGEAPPTAGLDEFQLSKPGYRVEPAQQAPSESSLVQLNQERAQDLAGPTQPAIAPLGGPQQLNTGPRQALAPDTPTDPTPGRITLENVEGQDLCDPGRLSDREVEVCRNLIESRAAEFAPAPPPQLSAEERSALETANRRGDADADAVARRIGRGELSPADAAQAYVYSRQSPAGGAQEAPKSPTALALEAAAQVLGLSGGAIQPPPPSR